MGVATTTSVGCTSPNPSVLGHATYFNATVYPADYGAPSGTVQFKIGGVNYGAPLPVSLISGFYSAYMTVTDAAALSLGAKSITASYSGDGTYDPSLSDAFIQNVATSSFPDAITDLTATVVSSSAINLAWTLPYNGNSPITGVQVYVDYVLRTTVGLQSFANIVGLTPSTTYQFVVMAVNANVGALSSNMAMATTLTASAAGGALVNNGQLLLTNGKLVITV